MTVRALDHTADIGFEVRSPDRSSLFAECALALARSIASEEGLVPREEHAVDLVATTLEELLVDWLEEQVFLCDTRGLLTVDCMVEIHETPEAGYRLLGVLRGDRYDVGRHRLQVQVKAVTYHGLKVERRDGEWFARVILDI
jgi:SHS2 domain-containing protein